MLEKLYKGGVVAGLAIILSSCNAYYPPFRQQHYQYYEYIPAASTMYYYNPSPGFSNESAASSMHYGSSPNVPAASTMHYGPSPGSAASTMHYGSSPSPSAASTMHYGSSTNTAAADTMHYGY